MFESNGSTTIEVITLVPLKTLVQLSPPSSVLNDPKLDSIVRTEAARLRARLLEYYARDGSGDPIFIEVPKGGYKPIFRNSESPRRRRPRVLAPFLILLAAVVIAIGWWSAQGAFGPVRIAVLPLQNLSTEPDSEYFADGLTDEIISNLSLIEDSR